MRIRGTLHEGINIYDISLSPSQNEKFFWQKLYKKSKSAFMLNNFFPENRAVYEAMWKNMA
jgi:hypothetical protein